MPTIAPKLSARRPARSLAWCLVWMVGCCVPVGLARAQTTVGITDGSGYPGTDVSVRAYQSAATNVLATQFDLLYDANRVSLLGVVSNSLPSGVFLKSALQTNGLRRFVLYSVLGPLPSGVGLEFVRLPFHLPATEHVGSGPITPANLIVGRGDTNAASPVLVRPGTIYAQPIRIRTNGVAEFFFASQAGTNYTVQATTNFVFWVDLTNVTATSDWLEQLDTDAPLYPHRFYRTATTP